MSKTSMHLLCCFFLLLFGMHVLSSLTVTFWHTCDHQGLCGPVLFVFPLPVRIPFSAILAYFDVIRVTEIQTEGLPMIVRMLALLLNTQALRIKEIC